MSTSTQRGSSWSSRVSTARQVTVSISYFRWPQVHLQMQPDAGSSSCSSLCPYTGPCLLQNALGS